MNEPELGELQESETPENLPLDPGNDSFEPGPWVTDLNTDVNLDETNPTASPLETGITFYGDEQGLVLQLPPETGGDWETLWQQLQLHLQGRPIFWRPQAELELRAGNRLLDQRHLQQLVEALTPAQISLSRIVTSRRQTAIAAATLGYSVVQQPQLTLTESESDLAEKITGPLYLETTLRSGTEICHPGTVIVVGDLNPGSSIIAGGDILVWGRIRGIVHAGAQGNRAARIMGIYVAATQLRIADLVARTPQPPADFYPEVAYASSDGIRIAPASQFQRSPLSNL